ncbi:MAG: threonine ammonia-lyase [Betaproteobacteria bacterium]|nr:threonine ammonia-lyase [Betaproteobacteria bacterium]
MLNPEFGLPEIRAAAARIGASVERTPFLHSRTLSARYGAQVFIKFENLQFTASFKERGALNKLLTLSAAERQRGVIAMSAGNHAQGVAYHATRLGMRAVIVMPRGTPNVKVKAAAVHGARIVIEGENLAEASQHAHLLAEREGLVFIHPYDDPLIIAGQGTVALEMLEDVPDLDCLIVPVGGGGLIAGMATAAKALKPELRVFGVESRSYCAMYQRLKGLPVEVGGDTIAEGLAVRDVGETALSVVRGLVDEMLLVDEETIERAIVDLIEIEKTVAEGAGACGLAALIEHGARFAGQRIGIPLCGGNIDSRVLAAVLMRGLVRDGRLLRLRVAMPDISGSLAKAAGLIGEAGGNILEVQHERLFGRTSVKTPEVEFVVETRDREHGQMLISALRERGARVTLAEEAWR